MGRLFERKTGPAIYEGIFVWVGNASPLFVQASGSRLDISNRGRCMREMYPVPRDPCFDCRGAYSMGTVEDILVSYRDIPR